MEPFKATAFFLLMVLLLPVISPFPVNQQSSGKREKARSFPVVISQYSNVRNSKNEPPVVVEPPQEPKTLEDKAELPAQVEKQNSDTDEESSPHSGVVSLNEADQGHQSDKLDKLQVTEQAEEKDAKEPVAPQLVSSSAGALESDSIEGNKHQPPATQQDEIKAHDDQKQVSLSHKGVLSLEEEKPVQHKDKITIPGPVVDDETVATVPPPETTEPSIDDISETTQPTEDAPKVVEDNPITVEQNEKTETVLEKLTELSVKQDEIVPKPEEKVDLDQNGGLNEEVKSDEVKSTKVKEEGETDATPEFDQASKTEFNKEVPQDEPTDAIKTEAVKEEDKSDVKSENSKKSEVETDNLTSPIFNLPIGDLFEEDRSFKGGLEDFSLSALSRSDLSQSPHKKLDALFASSEDLDNTNDSIRLEREDKEKKGEEFKKETKEKDKDKEKEKEKVTEKEKILGKPFKESKPFKQSKPVISDDPVQEYGEASRRKRSQEQAKLSPTEDSIGEKSGVEQEEPVIIGIVPDNAPVILPSGESSLSDKVKPQQSISTQEKPIQEQLS